MFRYGLRNPERPRRSRRLLAGLRPARTARGNAVASLPATRCRPKIGDFRDHGRPEVFRTMRFDRGAARSACVTGSASLSRARGAGRRERRGSSRKPRPFSPPGPGRSVNRNRPTGQSVSEHRQSDRANAEDVREGRPARSAGRDLNPEEDGPACSLRSLRGLRLPGVQIRASTTSFPDADCSRRVAVAPRRSPCCVGKTQWTRRDLNPGPLPCEGSDLPLIYEPSVVG